MTINKFIESFVKKKQKQGFKKVNLYGMRLIYCMVKACLLYCGGSYSLASHGEAQFCMVEAHEGQGALPSYINYTVHFRKEI